MFPFRDNNNLMLKLLAIIRCAKEMFPFGAALGPPPGLDVGVP